MRSKFRQSAVLASQPNLFARGHALDAILRWAGSKRRLLPALTPLWPSSEGRYVEPFAGSACFFFAIEPRRAFLSDTNSELIEMYRAVRDKPAEVWRQLRRFRCSASDYYRTRLPRVTPRTASYDAARFIFLNRYCFNGLYRTNRAGAFNVPFGGTKNGKLPNLEMLTAASRLLRRARLRSVDFRRALRSLRQGDFVYLDPPYADDNVRIFRQYGATTFGVADLYELSEYLHCVDALGVSFVLSYADSPAARTLLAHWRRFRIDTVRNIAGFARSRRVATELIVTNLPSRRTTHLDPIS